MNLSTRFAAGAVAAVLAMQLPATASATALGFTVGDATSGFFGDAKIPAGMFTDTLAFNLAQGGTFSSSLTSATTAIGASGDLDFTSVVLTGPNGPFNFTIRNNDNADGLTDSAVFTGTLASGSYLLTIMANSFGNSQFGGNTTLRPGDSPSGSVPEPAAWLTMVVGFGALGAVSRRDRKSALV